MTLREYFEKHTGYGVLATADSEGKVDAAFYSRPYVVDETTVAFIMADRLTRKNLLSNPHAAYLFKEPGETFAGMRLFLTMDRELRGPDVTDPDISDTYRNTCREYNKESLSVMYFRVDKILALVGDEE
jgi:hypothetical protein